MAPLFFHLFIVEGPLTYPRDPSAPVFHSSRSVENFSLSLYLSPFLSVVPLDRNIDFKQRFQPTTTNKSAQSPTGFPETNGITWATRILRSLPLSILRMLLLISQHHRPYFVSRSYMEYLTNSTTAPTQFPSYSLFSINL